MTIYVLMALAAGVNIVISTSINAALGKRIGVLNNAMVFYTIALIASAAAFILFSGGEPLRTGKGVSIPYFVYIGSLVPVATLLLSTYTMQKVSVVNYVMITYISEIITAAAIDYFIYGAVNITKIIGVIFMIAGIYADNRTTGSGG
jgi:transporter family-2 protein